MKKISNITIVLLISIIALFVGTIYISANGEENWKKPAEQLVNDLKKHRDYNITEFSIKEYDMKNACKVKPLNVSAIIEEYRTKGTLEEAASDYERIIVPCRTYSEKDSIITLCYKDNELSYAGQAVNIDDREFGQKIDFAKVNESKKFINERIIGETIYVSDLYETYLIELQTEK